MARKETTIPIKVLLFRMHYCERQFSVHLCDPNVLDENRPHITYNSEFGISGIHF